MPSFIKIRFYIIIRWIHSVYYFFITNIISHTLCFQLQNYKKILVSDFGNIIFLILFNINSIVVAWNSVCQSIGCFIYYVHKCYFEVTKLHFLWISFADKSAHSQVFYVTLQTDKTPCDNEAASDFLALCHCTFRVRA